MTTFADVLARRLRADPGQPLVTYYDLGTGERVELSVTTYANWVAKTASLLAEEHDLERGQTLRVALRTHWLGPVFLGAAWAIGLTVTAIAGAAVAVSAGVLKDYQVDRFLAFTNPGLDPRGAGYNTEQARIAVGNGGLFGQGLFDGSQTRSGFVPEQHTDFIFTVAGEELGLVGSGVLIALLGLVLWRALTIAAHAEDLFGRLAAGGIACWFGFPAFQNIGMCLGIMPVTSVPLPLVSYGGSSMFATLMAIGLLQNIHLRSERSMGLGVARSRLVRSRF